jgi:hypothetical protein
MRITKRTVKPTEAQAKWLRRIAQSPLMKTYIDGEPMPRFSLQSGATVPTPIAEVLIRNGWVKGRRDGLFGDEQSYIPRERVYEALRP